MPFLQGRDNQADTLVQFFERPYQVEDRDDDATDLQPGFTLFQVFRNLGFDLLEGGDKFTDKSVRLVADAAYGGENLVGRIFYLDDVLGEFLGVGTYGVVDGLPGAVRGSREQSCR